MAEVTFQQGVGGYSGTSDTYIRESRPTNTYDTQPYVYVDGADKQNGEIQGLLEFSDLFGDGPGQIPLGATITSATLTFAVGNGTSDTISFYRMAEDWTSIQELSWDGFVDGVQTDGTEALQTADATLNGVSSGPLAVDVTQSLQAWSNGGANYGWLLTDSGANGMRFDSSESAGAPILAVTYEIASEPVPGVTVSESGGNTVVTEGGANDTISVVLDTAPTSDVTVTISTAGGSDVSIAPLVLTFTSANWDTVQTVSLAAVDDAIIEGTETFDVDLALTSGDLDYDGLSSTVSVVVIDNDGPPAGLTVTETGGSSEVTEGGAGDSFTVVLDSAPISDVTVTVSTTGTGDLTVAPQVLTFTSTNWNTAQTVNLAAVDDTDVEGTENFSVDLTTASADVAYDNLTSGVSVSVFDNDVSGPGTAEVTFQQGVNGYTGTSDTYIRESRPGKSYETKPFVYIDGADKNNGEIQGLLEFSDLFGNGPGQIPLGATITSATLTFAVGNGTSDTISFYRMATDWTSGQDLTWDGFVGGIQTDGTEALQTADVTLNGVSSGPLAVDVTQSLQAWSNGGASFGWLLTDSGANGMRFDSSESAAAPILSVTYEIASEPVPGVTVSETGGNTVVTEGGAGDTFTVVLDAAPTSDVTVTISTAGGSDVSIAPLVLTFTSANWDTAQTVSLAAVDDAIIEGTETFDVDLALTSGDLDYDGLSSTVSVAVIDNDAPPAGLTVTETGGSSEVTEGGAGDSFTVVLDSAPTSNVTVTVSTAGSGDLTVAPQVLTFTSTNWNTVQTVNLAAVDDTLIEGTESFSVDLTTASADVAYDNLTSGVSVSIYDNDFPVPGLSLTETGGSTVVTEGGAGDTFTVVLDTAPTSDVTVTLSTTGADEFDFSPQVLTFTSANWNTAQTIALGAIDDTVSEATESYNLDLATSSADGSYDGLLSSVSVSVIDNDAPPTLTPSVVAIHDTTQYTAGDPSGYGSGDPSGICFIPGLNQLFIADSEHNESPYFSTVNAFVANTDGSYVQPYSLQAFTNEPTGFAYNPLNGLMYITDDDQKEIFIVDPNDPSVLLGQIDVGQYGINDAEDPQIDPTNGHIFLLDGNTTSLIELSATGDQVINWIDLPSVMGDAEGLAYDSIHDVFFVASGADRGVIFEIDRQGNLIDSFDLLNDYRNPITGGKPKIKGLELAPSSDPNDGDTMSLYAVDYGYDQVADGRLIEISLHDDWLVA